MSTFFNEADRPRERDGRFAVTPLREAPSIDLAGDTVGEDPRVAEGVKIAHGLVARARYGGRGIIKPESRSSEVHAALQDLVPHLGIEVDDYVQRIVSAIADVDQLERADPYDTDVYLDRAHRLGVLEEDHPVSEYETGGPTTDWEQFHTAAIESAEDQLRERVRTMIVADDRARDRASQLPTAS